MGGEGECLLSAIEHASPAQSPHFILIMTGNARNVHQLILLAFIMLTVTEALVLM